MAKELNLEFTQLPDGGIRVTWQDPVLAEFSNAKSNMGALVVGGGALVWFIVTLATFNLIWVLVAIVWTFGGMFLFGRERMVQRSVTFTPSNVIHEGRSYPTEEITRFEYGLRYALTGVAPARNEHTTAVDPMLIRMWLNDAKPIELSQNNWQTQVNHEIRDALDRALTAVRQEQVEAERVATYGQQDDKGMPEY